jgi:autotransporter-associated beta strand protein
VKHHFALAIACLAIVANDLPANPAFTPSKVVIIKADDYSGNYNSQQQKWTDFVIASRSLGIRVSLGVVPARIPADNAAAQWMQQQQAVGDVEFWNHGWDHSRDPADPPTYWEFRSTPLADQQEHFADAQAALLAATGRAAIAFGAPYNQTDADTMAVMNQTPAIRLFFTYNSSTARSQGLVPRVHTVGIIAESGGTGKPVASTFINTYPNGPAGPVSLQFHPAAFTSADLAEYGQVIQFLLGKGYTFMLPAEYVAALDGSAPEGARIWSGATDANWSTGTNWSPGGAPASGADVAFDGSGANLDTQFNGTARSLNSLTFTTGQTSQVRITTTHTAPLTLAPTGATGTWTTVNVAAGNQRFTGSDGGTSTPADFRFGAANGTTHILNIGASAAFEIKGRIDNGGANTKSFQKTGTGTLVLSGNSGGTGAWIHSAGSGFQIQQGVLRFAALNAGGNSGNNYLVTIGAALELDGNFNQTINNGTYTLNGSGIGGTGALRNLSGTKSITGSGTGGINLATNATIGVDADNLTISQLVKGPGSLTKVGSGTLTLTGANTYSGATVVSGGTLALGASEVLPATPVSVGTATLSVGAGFSETTGRLDVTGAATLNLGNDSSTIAFADHGDLLDWPGTLDIAGAFVPGVSLRFGANAGGLTAAQLAKITVNGTGAYTLDAAGYLAGPVAITTYTYVDATPANTTLNGAPLVDRNTNPTSGNYHNESTGSAGTGTDGRWSYRTGSAFATFEGAACFESDGASVTGDAENTQPLVTTITPGAPGTFDVVALFTRQSNRDIAARTGSAPTASHIFTIANAWNADQNLLPEPQIVFDGSYTNSRGTNMGAAYLGQVTTTTAGQSVSIYVNGFDSLAGTQDERTQYEGVGFRPANANPPKHYDVYLIAGQSNADGRGTNAELSGALAPYAGPQPDVKIFYVNPTNSDPVNPTYNTGWTTLAPGYAVAPGFSGALPSARFGFEVSLGKALAAKDPSRNIAIIKVTRGGTNLHTQWDPAGGDNFMWRTFANKVPAALAALTANGDTAEIHGMFWHQGESDGSNPTYQTDLAEFIAACRTLTGKPALPFAIGDLERDNVTPDVTSRTYQLSAMADVAAADPNTFVVSSEGLLTYDGTHFTSAAYITFGQRYATAYQDYMDGLAGTGPTPFEIWIGSGAVTFPGDANGDGIADGLAWLLGATTPAANATRFLPSPAANTGALEVSFTMRNQASRGTAVLKLQHGTRLGSWTTVTIPEQTGPQDGVGFEITPDGTLNHVVATIPPSAAPDGRLFIRLSGSAN